MVGANPVDEESQDPRIGVGERQHRLGFGAFGSIHDGAGHPDRIIEEIGRLDDCSRSDCLDSLLLLRCVSRGMPRRLPVRA